MDKRIEQIVKQAIVDALSLDILPKEIRNEDSCVEPPLYLDSLAKLRIFVNIEDMLNIRFEEEDITDSPPFFTVSDIICFMEEKLQNIKKEEPS